MTFEPVDIYVKDTTSLHRPVSGVVVKVLSADGRMVYSQQVTDTIGCASFLLPSEVDFAARFYKFGVMFGQPQLFTVLSPLPDGQSNSFDVEATTLMPPVPLDPRLCTAYGYFRDVSGAPLEGAEFTFVARFNPTRIDGAGVLSENVTVRTDKNGYAQVNLFRNGQYTCLIGSEVDSREVHVPDTINVNLVDLLYPIIDRVETLPVGPFILTTGEELPLGMHVITSDGRDLGVAVGDVRYRSSDHTIVGFHFTKTELVLEAFAPGTALITIERADLSIVHIPSSGVAGQPFLVTVLAPSTP